MRCRQSLGSSIPCHTYEYGAVKEGKKYIYKKTSCIKKSFFLFDISMVADDDINVHVYLPNMSELTAMHQRLIGVRSLSDIQVSLAATKPEVLCALTRYYRTILGQFILA